jgi:DNA modification methylase
MSDRLRIINADALEALRTLPTDSIHCCVTSPPYWGLRDYGTASWEGGDDGCDHAVPLARKGGNAVGTKQTTNPGSYGYREWLICGKCGAKRIDSQLGLEKTPDEYAAKMVEVFREVRRVLRKDGTLWLNLGDSYNAGRDGGWAGGKHALNEGRNLDEIYQNRSGANVPGLKPKDLCGIPWRVAFALQADGWYLRQDIIWAKPNPMPESVTDRCTKAHEYLFLLTKSASYYFDNEAIREREKEWILDRSDGQFTSTRRPPTPNEHRNHGVTGKAYETLKGANKRSVWTVATAPYPEAHFATYPSDLIKPCIMAGTSAKGCCAKCGAPWERIVERETKPLGRSYDSVYTGKAYVSPQSAVWGAKQNLGGDGLNSKTLGWQPTCECMLQADIQLCGIPVPCTVLDPFAGSGTTGAVALELGRKAILIELNPKYVELIEQRCNVTPGLALA